MVAKIREEREKERERREGQKSVRWSVQAAHDASGHRVGFRIRESQERGFRGRPTANPSKYWLTSGWQISLATHHPFARTSCNIHHGWSAQTLLLHRSFHILCHADFGPAVLKLEPTIRVDYYLIFSALVVSNNLDDLEDAVRRRDWC